MLPTTFSALEDQVCFRRGSLINGGSRGVVTPSQDLLNQDLKEGLPLTPCSNTVGSGLHVICRLESRLREVKRAAQGAQRVDRSARIGTQVQ